MFGDCLCVDERSGAKRALRCLGYSKEENLTYARRRVLCYTKTVYLWKNSREALISNKRRQIEDPDAVSLALGNDFEH